MGADQTTPVQPSDRSKTVEMNEALLLGSLRQHELTEAAENLNARLETEVAAHKVAEAALRQSEALFSALIDRMPSGVYVVDAQLRMQQVNPQSAPVFRNIDPLIGCDLADVMRILWGMEVGREVVEIFRHTLETGEHYVSPRFSERRHDLGEEQAYEWEIQRVTLPGGEHAVVCYFTDITERVRAAQALRATQERFRVLFDSGPVAIFSCDREGVLQDYNRRAAALWGWEPKCGDGRVRNCGSLELYHADGQPLTEEESPIVAVLTTGTVIQDAEVFIGRQNGSRIAVAGTFAPLKSAQGEIVGAIAAFHDITERRLLEDSLVARAGDLARADRSKDEFLAMLAHELRNPLAPLSNAAEILRLPDASAEEREQAHRILGRSIENMSRMIDDLLDIARITEGKIELRRKPVALEEILTSATSLARAAFAACGQELTVSLPAEPLFLHADATRLEQVFNNLLGNASKYSGEGSHIWLTAERAAGVDPPKVIVRVRDDGVGIAPELLPHVFDLFVQASRTLDRAHGGLGIGLTLVSRLVKLHGGRVEAHSEGLGHGSEFIVHLPLLREAPSPPATAPRGPSPRILCETPRRILIVDDNTDSARSLATLQSRRGHETRTAFTGPDAVAAAAEFKPAVVLLDIGLPGMDGFEVARRIRAMPDLGGVFIVAMSGYGSDEDRRLAKEAGFDEFLVKPADLDLLREWMRTRV